jgi:hypothetical protein
VRYLSNLYEVQNREKSLFDAVEYEHMRVEIVKSDIPYLPNGS